MESAIDRMKSEVMLPGMDDEIQLLLNGIDAENDADSDGPRDEQGYRLHTASTLLKRRPIAYVLIPKLAEEGMGVRGLSRVFEVSVHTVSAVLVREGKSETVSKWRSNFSKQLRGNSKLAIARLTELLADDKAVKEAGLKGLGAVLRELCKAMEMFKDAEKTNPIDTSSAIDAEEADEYMKQLEEENVKS